MNKTYDKDAAAQATTLRFYDLCNVPFKAGAEPVKVVLDQEAGGRIAAESSPILYLRVEGPHDRLQPTDVVGCYPADGSDTSPDELLPHIALERRSLPWERDGVKDGAVSTPWLALLLFRESEIIAVGNEKIRTLTLSALKGEDDDSYAALKTVYADDARLDLIRVTRFVLGRVLPRKQEIGLLCHVQKLVGNTAGDGDAGDSMWTLDPDCQVAIVVANRLPDAGTGAAPERHIACLVSVENREDLPWPKPWPETRPPYVYPGAAPAPKPGTKPGGVPAKGETSGGASGGMVTSVQQLSFATLVVLRHWSFTPSAGGDFEQVVQLIRYSPNGGVLRFGGLPRHLSRQGGGLDMLTLDGKLELKHNQGGTVTFGGPLTPAAPSPRGQDYALRATPASPGPGHDLDDSYAAAFELGRLLTLADEGLLADLQDLRLRRVMPQIIPKLAMNQMPEALQERLWGVYPPWEASRLPDVVADPGGVESIVGQLDQIAGRLNAVSPVSQAGESFDINIDTTPIESLDVFLAPVVAAQKR